MKSYLGFNPELAVYGLARNSALQDVGFARGTPSTAVAARRQSALCLPRPRGPVDSPPWNRQRRLPGTTVTGLTLPLFSGSAALSTQAPASRERQRPRTAARYSLIQLRTIRR